GRDHDPHGSTLSQRSGLGGKEVLALRAIRRNAPSHQCRAAAAALRGHPHRRYERVEFLGGIRCPLPQHPKRLSRPRTGKSELKALMPEDAREAIGHGVKARRSKSGAVSFDVLAPEATNAPLQ